jgi:hypothetical protein
MLYHLSTIGGLGGKVDRGKAKLATPLHLFPAFQLGKRGGLGGKTVEQLVQVGKKLPQKSFTPLWVVLAFHLVPLLTNQRFSQLRWD